MDWTGKILLLLFGIGGMAYSDSLLNMDYILEVDTNIGCNITLPCAFEKSAYCQWKLDNRTIHPSHHHRYKKGHGSHTNDCSLRILNVRNNDLSLWTCESYEDSSRKGKPDSTVHYYVHTFRPHLTTGICNPNSIKAVYIPRNKLEKICTFNTYVDECYTIHLDPHSIELWPALSFYSFFNKGTKNTRTCSASHSTEVQVCGGGKELHQKVIGNNEKSVMLKCHDIMAPINCTWRRNHEEVAIDGHRYRYLTNEGLNTSDCSLQLNHLQKRDMGIWECRMTLESSTNFSNEILDIYQLMHEESEQRSDTANETPFIMHQEMMIHFTDMLKSILVVVTALLIILIIKFMVAIFIWLVKIRNKRKGVHYNKMSINDEEESSTTDIQMTIKEEV